jgi:hypothetical protein
MARSVNRGESRFGGGLDCRIGRNLRERLDEALRVLIAAFLQCRDRRETVLRRRPVARCQDRGPSQPQGRHDPGVTLLRELRLERRQRLGVTGFEHVLRRREPLLRISAGERQRSDRPLDGLPQRVVDAYLLEGGCFRGRNRLSGFCVKERSCRSLICHDVIGRIDQQPIVSERVEDCGPLRRRLGREFADRLLGLGKLVVEKPRQGVVERVSARGAGKSQTREEGEGAEKPTERRAAMQPRAPQSEISYDSGER